MILIQTKGLETTLASQRKQNVLSLISKPVSFLNIAASRNVVVSRRSCFKAAVAITS